MATVLAVNGSPNQEKGQTAMLLAPFFRGMESAGAETEVVYASRLHINPCDCGEMYCWGRTPGTCYHRDDMDDLYPRLRETDVLVLATPVYVPLPGDMQNLLNRLVPLLDPVLETRQERTRARFREGVRIEKLVLLATGYWWEKENLDTVVRIAEELAEDASVEFAGAVLRPHAYAMTAGGKLTSDGAAVLRTVERAGRELVERGTIAQDLLDAISRPLISREESLRQQSE